jgi:RNA polymerase sigma-70 factor (ECF subfamily)
MVSLEPTGAIDERQLLDALIQGDETAFSTLVDRYHASMLRVSTLYVADEAVAEDVVQETWLDVLQGLKRFEGRSSLKTWIFRILSNNAKTRGKRESRSVPFSSFDDYGLETDEPAVEHQRFLPEDHPNWPGHWAVPPQPWNRTMEELALMKELMAHVEAAINGLPPSQRAVITVRDIEGYSAEEACNIFDLSETNQRVLLHRARSKVRRVLERYFDPSLERT